MATAWLFVAPGWGQGAKPPEDMVPVPAGPFILGYNGGDREGGPRQWGDCGPEQRMDLPLFYIDRTEVTNAQYARFLQASKLPPPPQWKTGTFPDGEGNYPVTNVNWWEARAFAIWAGKRLPTEYEWEKAARGTDGRQYPWGNGWEGYRVAFNRDYPEAVGNHPQGAAPCGALDMAGNVFEWTDSWYQAYPESTRTYPEYGRQYKVVRGGGYDGFESICRTYYRSVARLTTRSEWVGIRCAWSPPSSKTEPVTRRNE